VELTVVMQEALANQPLDAIKLYDEHQQFIGIGRADSQQLTVRRLLNTSARQLSEN
jgi:hypothetical protein